jgi:hypothetical protein
MYLQGRSNRFPPHLNHAIHFYFFLCQRQLMVFETSFLVDRNGVVSRQVKPECILEFDFILWHCGMDRSRLFHFS